MNATTYQSLHQSASSYNVNDPASAKPITCLCTNLQFLDHNMT